MSGVGTTGPLGRLALDIEVIGGYPHSTHERHGGHHDAEPDGVTVRQEGQTLRPAAWSVAVTVTVADTVAVHESRIGVATVTCL